MSELPKLIISPTTRAALIASSLAINTLMLALPIATLQIYDRVLTHPGGGTLALLIAGVVGAIILETTLRLVRARVTSSAAHAYERQASANLVAHVLHSWVTPAQKRHSSEYLQALSALGRMKEYALQRMIAISVDVPYLLLFLVALALIGGWLVLVPMLAMILFASLVLHWGLQLRKALAERNTYDEARYGFMLESLSGVHVMKSLGVEPRFIQKYQKLQQPVSRVSFKIALINHMLSNGAALFSQMMIVAVVASGAPLVMHNTISMGALIASVLLSGRLIQPLQHALTCWMSYQEFDNAQKQAAKIRSLPRQPLSFEHHRNEQDGHVAVEQLEFSYDDEHPVLRGITLVIPAGETLAISGEGSSGRSTLLKTIAGILPPTGGSVRIHGMDPASMPPTLLSENVAYLEPEAVLFRGTILQNLCGFDPDMQEQALELSRLIGLDMLVSQLPGGYETELEGSPADVIPPGLRQRVTIVRALRHKPKLILFDQADRNLDRDGYHQLFSLMARLRGKATVVMVTDDQNLLRLADRRLLMHEGQLHMLDSISGRGAPHLSLIRRVGMA